MYWVSAVSWVGVSVTREVVGSTLIVNTAILVLPKFAAISPVAVVRVTLVPPRVSLTVKYPEFTVIVPDAVDNATKVPPCVREMLNDVGDTLVT